MALTANDSNQENFDRKLQKGARDSKFSMLVDNEVRNLYSAIWMVITSYKYLVWHHKVDFCEKCAIFATLGRVRGQIFLKYEIEMGHFVLRASIHIRSGAYMLSF